MTFQRLRDVHFFSCYSALFTPFASIVFSPHTLSFAFSFSLSYSLALCLFIQLLLLDSLHSRFPRVNWYYSLVYSFSLFFSLFFFSPRLSCCCINHLTFRFPLRSYASAILPRCRREDVERRLRLRFASSGHQSQRKSISLFRLESS